MVDSTKDNFSQPLRVIEVVNVFEISKDDYYRVFSVSKDEDLGIHWKREDNSCFVYNYLEVDLKA